MEKIIHFVWVHPKTRGQIKNPKDIPPVQLEIIDCARKTHPTWEIKVWQDPIQTGGFLLEKYWSKANSGAQYADLLRLDVLYRFGGVYVDSDLRLLKPLDDLAQNFDFFIASEDGYNLTNALIGARKESPILRYLIDQLVNNEPDWSILPHITTGPIFFSHQLKWRKEIMVLPRETFYPYMGRLLKKPKVHRYSYGEHLWVGSWVPPASESRLKRWRSDALKWVKPYVKKNVIRGFRAWHRVKSVDPLPLNRFYQCSDELVIQTIHGFNIIVDGHDVSLTPELVFKGYYELPEENFLKNAARGGDWVIDVGANVGSFSLLAAQQVGQFGRVFAFEPNPRPSQLMAKSLVMNWMHERVIQRPVAVGNSHGTVELSFVADRLGDGRVGKDDVTGSTFDESLKTLGHDRTAVLVVQCVRLDDEFPVDVPIKVLKIDVEGYEGRVLAGAKRLLQRRCIDFIVLELLYEVAGSRWREIVDQVSEIINYGYAIATLTSEGTLVEQKDLAAAIRAGGRNIVLVAQEQYMPVRSST
jgi:FkbM family methyltransferase